MMERLLCGLTLLLTAGSILAGGNIYQRQGATWNKKLIRKADSFCFSIQTGFGLERKSAGDEVVQLYIRDDFSSVTTYEKILRGFERIHLQPSEEQIVSFTLSPQDLGLWDKNNLFTVEPGSFSVMVGASSQDTRLKGNFEVK